MNWSDYMEMNKKNDLKIVNLIYKINNNPNHPKRCTWIKQLQKLTPADEMEYTMSLIKVKE